MMIAPGEAGSDALSDPTPDIGPLDSARGWSLRSGESDKARTLRTKHGPLGCRGKSSAAGLTKSDCSYKTHAAEATSCQRVVPPAAERSVLCPQCPRFVRFSMSVETSHVWQSLR